MKLNIERKDMREALRKAQQVTPRNPSGLPILACVRLEASTDGRLGLAATNMDQHLTLPLTAQVEAPGTICVNLERLAAFAGNAPEGSQIGMRLSGAQLHLTAGRTRARVGTLPAEEFPAWEQAGASHRAGLRAADLLGALARVQAAQSTEETRYYLNGTYLHRHGETTLRLVATDGHRLHVAHAEADGALEWPEHPGVILPRGAVAMLPKLLDDAGDVEIGGDDRRLRVTQDGLTFGTRLIDGTFPEYERVIPAESNTVVRVDRQALRTVAERVRQMAADKNQRIGLRFEAERIRLAARTSDDPPGIVADAVEADVPDPPPADIAFNGVYIRDALDSVDGERASFTLTDGAHAVILRGDAGDARDKRVVMPVRDAFPEIPEDVE